jgi:branched-chain amino acid transport system substrate-binding protein
MNSITPDDEPVRGSRPESRGWRTRISLLATVFAVLVASVAFAACGDDDDDEGGGGGGASATIDSPDAQEFRDLVGISDEDLQNLQGETIDIGAILPLSGPGAEYAVAEQNGLTLAIEEMERYVGMDVNYEAKDHKSGDPQAGAAAARELGIDGYGVAMNSYYAVFGAALPDVQKYQMLSFDPGGGTGNALKGQDFFWGFRANTPDDGFVALRYFKQNDPSIKRVALVVWDAGDAYTGPIEDHLKEAVAENGMTYVGKELQPIGATDNSSILSALESKDPDLVWLVSYGADPGYFMKQFVDSGIDAQVVGSELTSDAANIAGPAFDEFMFAGDYFDFANPPNPLSRFFIKDYQRKFGEKPYIFYQPNYYEAGLAYLELARRVAAEGGDINDGPTLQDALEQDPTFVSVYGGSEDEVGEIELSAETHDPTTRPVGLFIAGPPLQQLAEWNIGGTDFRIVE